MLTPIEGAEHDYINANFIDVSNSVGLFLFTYEGCLVHADTTSSASNFTCCMCNIACRGITDLKSTLLLKALCLTPWVTSGG